MSQTGKGVEFRDGVISLFEERVCLFPPKIITILGNIYGEGSRPLLVYLGKKTGRSLVEVWEAHQNPRGVREMTNVFVDVLNSLGWGEFEVTSLDSDTDPQEIVVKLTRNVASSEENPKSHICDFISGFFYGFGEFIMHDAWVMEKTCALRTSGQQACMFHIMKREFGEYTNLVM
jgi:predicted hydrocarbon binding protein